MDWKLQTDLEYPDELHELHNDYPLASEKLAVFSDMLSKYCKKIADKYRIKVGDVKKLIPNSFSAGKRNLYQTIGISGNDLCHIVR